MATAKNRAIDRARRNAMATRKEEELGREAELWERVAQPDLAAAADGEIEDDLLSLIFTACHPVLPTEARVALTLKLVGALTTAEIARAFLVKEPTVAQRIVRAKRSLAEARVPIEVPGTAEREQRLASVLEVIYAIFNEGYAASGGEDWVRADLCQEAMRLGRVLAALTPDEPESLGLVALMELQAARFPARVGRDGEAIPLPEQDRSRWDLVLAGRGLAALARAEELGRPLGPYALQAARSRPTGSGSSPSMTRSTRSRPARPSSASTGRSPWGWPTARPPAWSCSKDWRRRGSCTAITYCRPPGASCSSGSGARKRHRSSSPAPPS
jgi:predicted RNA polymerase sigma factor